MTSYLEAIRKEIIHLIKREELWFEDLPYKDKVSFFGDDCGDLMEDFSHSGELACLAIGLKPCVLVDFPARTLLSNYVSRVIIPFVEKINEINQSDRQSHSLLVCKEIRHELTSPEESWRMAWVVFPDSGNDFDNPSTGDFSHAIKERILDENSFTIKEDFLANVLGYPGTLPNLEQGNASIMAAAYTFVVM
ncbi:hypothetical protein H4219_001610 [Mycoemilia scoparia]|uniref:Uncharacterized protein n=1 Tax=Mycoemilia scoparia TaxID=417184 RepID=A0A9W8DVX7_9FUNG|nr:hypothetical protein H4219_001610 [Mycoemilia scoparia]